jgi:predicted nucleotidyltransferase component of viral defense system
MRLNQQEHRVMMLRVLADISRDPMLAQCLGFKGGTCCYFLHGLNRFSVDLDFDSLDSVRDEDVRVRLEKVLAAYGEVKTKQSMRLVHTEGVQGLKVDVSTRHAENIFNVYEVVDVVSGVPVRALRREDTFAHKLVAITDRSKDAEELFIANRDLFDIHHFFTQRWNFTHEIVELRTGMSVLEYLKKLTQFIELHVDETNILLGLGELVTESQRAWVEKSLKKEVLQMLAIARE